MKKNVKKYLIILLILAFTLCGCSQKEEKLTTENDYKNYDRYAKQFDTNKEFFDERYDTSLAVKCKNGIFVGKKEGKNKVYRGIPYIANSEKSSNSNDENNGLINDRFDIAYEAYSFSCDDNLTLNIYSGSEDKANKPIMVWINDNQTSASDSLLYGHELLDANPDILYVTLNYGDDFSNVFYALNWIEENIEGFLGNSNNVTLFGDGLSDERVATLLENNNGLFKKIVIKDGLFSVYPKATNVSFLIGNSYDDICVSNIREQVKYSKIYAYSYNVKDIPESVLALNKKSFISDWSYEDMYLRRMYNKMFVEFARSGSPDIEEISWKRFTENNNYVMDFGDDIVLKNIK